MHKGWRLVLGVARRILFYAFLPVLGFRRYAEMTMFKGYYQMPVFGVLAYRDPDGNLLFAW